MANPEHVEIVKQGARAIARWRDKNPEVMLDLKEADLRKMNLDHFYLSGADLRGAYLSGSSLNHSNLEGANLSRAVLSCANIRSAVLTESDLSHSYMNKCNLSHSILKGSNLRGADLRDAHLFETDLNQTDLKGACLSNASLNDADLVEAKLVDADLSQAILVNANLAEADLSGANLSEVNLKWANLSGATLIKTDLSEANLFETLLRYSDLSDANLRLTKLKGVDFSNVKGYIITAEQEAENSKVEQPKIMSKGYYILLVCFMFVLGILGLGFAFGVIILIAGGEIQFAISVFILLCILAAFILVFGLCLSAISIAKEKGYAGIIGFYLVGVPFVGLPLDILIRYIFHQYVMDTFDGQLTRTSQKIDKITQDLLFSFDLFILLPLPLVGLAILTLLPNKKQRRHYNNESITR